MSDSGSGNSWTLLSQEENVATLRPLAEGTELHGDGKSQPTEVAVPAKTEHPVENPQTSEENMSGQFEGEASPSIAQNPSPTTSPTTTPTTSPTSDPSPTLIPPIETLPPPPSLVIPAHPLHGSDAHSQSEGLPEGPVEPSPDPDSFSDSYTHISPSPPSPPSPPLPELLGGLDLTEEEEDADRPESEGEGSEQGPSQPGSSVDPQVGEERGDAEGSRTTTLLASLEQIGRREEEEEPEEEFQLPRRNDDSGFSVNKCILGAVILLGLGTLFLSDSDYAPRDLRDAEQPVKQEWQNPEAPHAAVDEGMDILNKLVKETQQIAALQAKTQAQEEELNAARGRAAEGAREQFRRSRKEEEEVEEENVNEALLHPKKATTSPPGGQEGESRPATGSTEGQTKKPSHVGGEGEKTDSRDRGKTERKDQEWKKPNHDQHDKSKEVKGRKQKEEGREGREQGHRGDKGESWRERGDGKEGRGKEERSDQKEEKKWKKGKHDKLDSDRDEEGKGHEKEKKKGKERGDRKEWVGRDEERNDRKEEKQWKRGKEERKDHKEEREWKKGKSEKLDDDDGEKERRGQEEKRGGTGRKEHGKRKQEKEEWKKGKDGYKESGKEWKETKEWREKGDQKYWKKDTDRWATDERDQHRERRSGEGREERRSEEGKEERRSGKGKEKEERKTWEGKEERRSGKGKEKEERRTWEGKEKRRSEEGREEGREERRRGEGREERRRGEGREERKDADGKQDRKRNSGREEDVDHKKQEQHRHDHHREESLWQGPGGGRPTHTHRRPSFGQPEYWVHQRERLRQNGFPSRRCAGVEDCARAEGTLPVQLTEFQGLLEGYLAKAEQGAGVEASAGEEVRTLAAEFFKDGVFVHDRMSFRDYLEDLADILEDMVDGDDSQEDQEEDHSDLEDEMEMFGKEAMKRFAVAASSEKTSERMTGKSKKEKDRGRG